MSSDQCESAQRDRPEITDATVAAAYWQWMAQHGDAMPAITKVAFAAGYAAALRETSRLLVQRSMIGPVWRN
jgi:hypothetical protein